MFQGTWKTLHVFNNCVSLIQTCTISFFCLHRLVVLYSSLRAHFNFIVKCFPKKSCKKKRATIMRILCVTTICFKRKKSESFTWYKYFGQKTNCFRTETLQTQKRCEAQRRTLQNGVWRENEEACLTFTTIGGCYNGSFQTARNWLTVIILYHFRRTT